MVGHVRAAIILMACWLLLSGCQFGAPSKPDGGNRGELVIASDFPTTGNVDAQLGVPAQQAVRLALDQNPRIRGYTIRYEPFDDAVAGLRSPEKGVQNIRQMIDDPRVLGMVGPTFSQVALAEIPVANQASLAMLGASTTFDCLTQSFSDCDPQPGALRPTGRNNFFRIAGTDSLQGAAMAGFALKDLHVKRVAVVTQFPFLDHLVDSLARELSRGGGELVLREHIDSSAIDFTPFLAAARGRGAEAIYIASGSDTKICTLRAQMRTIFASDTYFLGWDGIVNDTCLKDAAENVTDRMYGTVADVDPTFSTDTRVKNVVQAYRKAYPKSSDLAPYTFAAYDCTTILVDAIGRAIDANGGKLPSRSQVVDAIGQTHNFKGTTGTFSFKANGDATAALMSIYQVRNGHWTFRRAIRDQLLNIS
jgi:branched-chain amino acid transport system substrate-binding protein